MEFDSCISKIQGALLSLQKRNLLNSKVSVEEVLTTLRDLTSNMTEDEKRKVTYYMVLNTQTSATEKLKEDENVYLFINEPVLLERNYLIDYVYNLKLQNYLFDVIKNGSSLITEEIIEDLIKKLNEPDFHRTEFGVDHMYKLWQAIFVKMYKIQQDGDDEGGDKMSVFFKKIYEIIRKAFFIFQMLSNEAVTEFMGECLYQFFDSILFFKNIESHIQYVDMYKLNLSQNKTRKNLCEESLKMIIDELQETLNEITIDLWMELSEYERENKTYQEAVGNIVYYLCEFEDFIPPDILNCLSVFKIKPKPPEVSEIIEKINGGEREWMKILLENSNLTDSESLKCVLENGQTADDEDVENILEKTSNGQSELGKRVFLKLLKSTKQTGKWLSRAFRNGNLECETFNEDLIETFNKISNDKNTWDVLRLFVQNPRKTLVKICECGVYNPNEIEFFVEVLKQVDEFDYDGKKEIGCVFLNVLTDCKHLKNLIRFVKSLRRDNLVGCDFFVLLIDKIEKDLKGSKEVSRELEVVKSVVDAFVVECDAVVLLCEMSELLEYSSWDVYSFSKVKAEEKELLEDVVDFLLKELKKEESYKRKYLDTLREFICRKSESTQAVFCDLWFDFEETWTGSGDYHAILLALAYTNQNPQLLFEDLNEPGDFVFVKNSITIALYMILPILTYRKWEILFTRLLLIIPEDKNAVLEIFSIFLSVLHFFAEKQNKNKKVCPFFEQSIRYLGRLIKSFYKKNNSDFAAVLLGKILYLCHSIEDRDSRKNYCSVLSPVLLELIEVVENGQDEILKKKLKFEMKTFDFELAIDVT